MASKYTINKPANFDNELADIKNKSPDKKIFIYVFAEHVDGKSWCPDCVVSDPIINEQFNKQKDSAILIECPVVRNEWKGEPNHPFKTHEQLKITALPTLLRWVNNEVTHRLVEGECHEENDVEKLMA
eukprot:gb/GECH01004219.1/.p1 GENE.gb/GECH01004219.1/~~gb/GECH01004219.1/.p1  ORF type:complete len:128 (+),score=37.06 gb/GECH01004219.1/:1-384(+)